MAINGRRNKPIGPGGSTRRLHHTGAKQDRRGRKGRAFARDGSAVSGRFHSCQRQLCSGCPGRV